MLAPSSTLLLHFLLGLLCLKDGDYFFYFFLGRLFRESWNGASGGVAALKVSFVVVACSGLGVRKSFPDAAQKQKKDCE